MVKKAKKAKKDDDDDKPKKKVVKKAKKAKKDDDDDKPKKKVAKKAKKKVKKEEEDDDEEEEEKLKKKVAKKAKKNKKDDKPKKKVAKKKVKKEESGDEDDEDEEEEKPKKNVAKKEKKEKKNKKDDKSKAKKGKKDESVESDGDDKPNKKLTAHEQLFETDRFVDLDNAVMIIDEVHNLFQPLPNQKAEHELLEKEIIDPRKHPNMKLVILTATPGDNVDDVIKLLNSIRDPENEPITSPNMDDAKDIMKFKESIRGLVSYFDMSGDTTKFPIVLDNDQSIIKVPMGSIQFEKYAEAYQKVTKYQKDYPALAMKNEISKYWEPVRKYANTLWDFEKNMKLSDFSSKMPYLINKINEYPKEKHYVYSAFYTKMGYGGQGIIAISKELLKQGYKQLTVVEAKKLKRKKELPEKGVKRFFLAITTELGPGNVGDNLKLLLDLFNDPVNKYGEYLQVMLASQKFNESLDLKAVSNIHFFEPLVSMAGDLQTLGRAARYCSFRDMNRDTGEWQVKIHRYMNEKPIMLGNQNGSVKRVLENDIKSLEDDLEDLNFDKKENKVEIASIKKEIAAMKKELKKISKPPKFDITSVEMIEEKIFNESRERFRAILTVYTCMREAAVDCRLMKDFHSSVSKGVDCAF